MLGPQQDKNFYSLIIAYTVMTDHLFRESIFLTVTMKYSHVLRMHKFKQIFVIKILSV